MAILKRITVLFFAVIGMFSMRAREEKIVIEASRALVSTRLAD